jgi:UrcA family protein
MKTLQESIATLTVAGLLVGFSATLSADPAEPQSPLTPDITAAVPAADLDLSKAEDVETLYQRIRRTARSLCKTEHSAPWDVKRNLHQRECFERAVERAVAGANQPALTALHRGAASRVASR